MTKRDDVLILIHAPHGWVTAASMETIRRVSRAADQIIMDCPCGWYGWVSQDALSASFLPGSTEVGEETDMRGAT